MEPAIEAGAVGFVGTLSNYPGDSRDYYVPYDGLSRPIPGVWVSGSDAARLRESLAAGPLRARLGHDGQDPPSQPGAGHSGRHPHCRIDGRRLRRRYARRRCPGVTTR
jgi:hypothetical protein